ncbi:hypothetical protein CIHG_07520 [Coccidioides immitis H538.4]|uniref:Uncharacterized protein n=1 Tax=Coccidioides immitis H538.4 TaxID=396776 RepID=A0A0J8UQB4_COCIT|nr:hypothetical protein CIHG_07520 [Coccidioides immitis H538.4]
MMCSQGAQLAGKTRAIRLFCCIHLTPHVCPPYVFLEAAMYDVCSAHGRNGRRFFPSFFFFFFFKFFENFRRSELSVLRLLHEDIIPLALRFSRPLSPHFPPFSGRVAHLRLGRRSTIELSTAQNRECARIHGR